MTGDDWSLILTKAADVLGDTTGLRESIEGRQRVALYWNRDDDLVGLCTVDLRPEEFMGRPVLCIYTGNAWLHPEVRGMNLVPKLGARCWLEAVRRWPKHTHYWFFGSNSYKSYLTMARNLVEFYPSRHQETPEWETQYIAHLAQEIYGVEINAETFVHSSPGSRSFREFEEDVEAVLQEDPDVRYFTQLNPGYGGGDKLMCLGPLTLNNWGKVLMRSIRRKLRK